MCIKGTTTTHLRSRWGRVDTDEGVAVVWFLTTLQRPVTGRFMDALNKAPL